jgi:hypothetical protein
MADFMTSTGTGVVAAASPRSVNRSPNALPGEESPSAGTFLVGGTCHLGKMKFAVQGGPGPAADLGPVLSVEATAAEAVGDRLLYVDLRRFIPNPQPPAGLLTPEAGRRRGGVYAVAYQRWDVQFTPREGVGLPGDLFDLSLWAPKNLPEDARPLCDGAEPGEWLPEPAVFEAALANLCALIRERLDDPDRTAAGPLTSPAVWANADGLFLLNARAFLPVVGPPSLADLTAVVLGLTRTYLHLWGRRHNLPAPFADLVEPGFFDRFDTLAALEDAARTGELRRDPTALGWRKRLLRLADKIHAQAKPIPGNPLLWTRPGYEKQLPQLHLDNELRAAAALLASAPLPFRPDALGDATAALAEAEDVWPETQRRWQKAWTRLQRLGLLLHQTAGKLKASGHDLELERTKYEHLEQYNATLQQHVKQFEKELHEHKAAAAKARLEAVAFQTANARLGQAVRAGEQRVNQLEREVTGLRTKLAKLEKDRDELQRMLQNHEARVNRVGEKLQAVVESVRDQVRVPFAARAAALVVDCATVALVLAGALAAAGGGWPDVRAAGVKAGPDLWRWGALAFAAVAALGARAVWSPGRRLFCLFLVRARRDRLEPLDPAHRILSGLLHYGAVAVAVGLALGWQLGPTNPKAPPPDWPWPGLGLFDAGPTLAECAALFAVGWPAALALGMLLGLVLPSRSPCSRNTTFVERFLGIGVARFRVDDILNLAAPPASTNMEARP